MIYILKEKGTNLYKIGFTANDVQTRIAGMQTGNPRQLELIITMDGDEELEAHIHRELWQYKTPYGGGSEWFELPETVVARLKEFDNGYADFQGSTIGNSAFDVRPLRGRQFDPATNGGENVPRQPSPVDNPRRKYPILIGR